MSDISVNEADILVLLQEILTRKTDEGNPLFVSSTFVAKDGRVQLTGIQANVEMKLDPNVEEESKEEE
jgi:hypothetical protein|tara:strand:+ start:675 stop:878 length:204 start_codon:yes stop_codon:yes gene_type:complete